MILIYRTTERKTGERLLTAHVCLMWNICDLLQQRSSVMNKQSFQLLKSFFAQLLSVFNLSIITQIRRRKEKQTTFSFLIINWFQMKRKISEEHLNLKDSTWKDWTNISLFVGHSRLESSWNFDRSLTAVCFNSWFNYEHIQHKHIYTTDGTGQEPNHECLI